MGLIPLILKDVPWPERQIVHISERLPWLTKVLVLALELMPLPAGKAAKLGTRQRNEDSNGLTRYVWSMHKSLKHLSIVVLDTGPNISYTGLAFNENYSKRSALNCVFLLFIAAW